jgi:soluble lytic murein transglycosylase-like protein
MSWFLLLAASSAQAQNSREAMRAAIQRQIAAAAIQRESVKKQIQELRAAPPPATADPSCDPMSPAQIDPIIESAAKANALDPDLVRAVIRQESGFRSCAVSTKGAEGLMQLMPVTIEQFAVQDPFDPKQSVETGAKYLKELLDRYKADVSLALAAYNAGPTTVDEAKGIPDIPETREYVDAILKSLAKPGDLGSPGSEPAVPVGSRP